jgi:hypothetical protein
MRYRGRKGGSGLETLRLQWRRSVGGYEIVTVPPPPDGSSLPLTGDLPAGEYVMPRGIETPFVIEVSGPITKSANIDIIERVLLGLANSNSTADILQFVATFGLPTGSPITVEALRALTGTFDEALSYMDLANIGLGTKGIERIVNRYAPPSRSTFENGKLYQTAPTLSAFCWLLLLRAISDEAPIRACSACHQWYMGARRVGKRKGEQVPKLCGSSRCKEKWQKHGLREATQTELQRVIERQLNARGKA